MPSFSVIVSLGELLDKYSILELKREFIFDSAKKACVILELSYLHNVVKDYIERIVSIEYKLLKYINKVIWDLNDNYVNLSEFDGKRIMNENNARFRIKNWINNKAQSTVKEQKSYKDTKCIIRPKPNTFQSLNARDVLLFAFFKTLYYDNVVIIIPKQLEHIRLILENALCDGEYGCGIDNISILDSYNIEHTVCFDIDISSIPHEFIDIMLNHKFH